MRSSRLLAAVAAGAVVATVPAAGLGAAAASATSLPATTTALTLPAEFAHATVLGALPATRTVHLDLWLALQNQTAATQTAYAVSTPGSASYHRYLTRAQATATFAPTAAEVATATTWALGHGLTVGAVGPDNLYVEAAGSTAAVERAFATRLVRYRVGGVEVYGPTATVAMPAGLRGTVSGVQGLDNHDRLIRPGVAMAGPRDLTPAPVFNNAGPCSPSYGEFGTGDLPLAYGQEPSYVICGNTPASLRASYGLPAIGQDSSGNPVVPAPDGTGQTVAIVDAYSSPTIVADANQWSNNYGLPPLAGTTCAQPTVCTSSQFTDETPGLEVIPEDPVIGIIDPQGWSTEETLDVEAIHAMAPGAAIDYFGATSNIGPNLAAALARAVSTPGVNEVSNSWGSSSDADSSDKAIYDEIGAIAGVTGVGVYFSSGDSGDQTAGTGAHPVPDAPATEPLFTAVGGTSMALASDGSLGIDTGWGTSSVAVTVQPDGHKTYASALPGTYKYGGGGGISTTWTQPTYQNGVVTAFSTTQRVEPDISAVGDPNTGLLIGMTQTQADSSTSYSEFREGGTSLACPVIAGIMAAVSQQQGTEAGFINPTLYANAKSGVSQLRDVLPLAAPLADARIDYVNGQDGATSESVRTYGVYGSLKVTTGYDDVTGLGEPQGLSFLSTGPGTNLPEAPLPALLAAVALLAGGAAVAVRRRRTSPATTAG